MKKSILGVAALSVVLATGNVWGTDEATSTCKEYAKEDGVSAEEMKDYMEQCLEDQRIASAELKQQSGENADNAGEAND